MDKDSISKIINKNKFYILNFNINRLIKACIPEGSGVITFAMETNQLCKDRLNNNKKINF
jgi:hypothetical protein